MRFIVLDSFRGLCALFVVIYHMHIQGTVTEIGFFKGSAQFVEFFFVLSGFVLTHGFGSTNELTFKEFIRRRFFRLYPLHAFMLIIVLLIEMGKFVAFKYFSFSFSDVPFTNRFALTELIPNILLLQSWTNFTNYLSFNFVSWSISIEFYLYIIFYFIISRFFNKRNIIFSSIFILALIIRIFDIGILVPEVIRGLTCFFGGSLIYLIFRLLKDQVKLNEISGTILEFITIFLIVVTVSIRFEYRDVALTFLFFVCVFIFAFESGLISQLLVKNIFISLGKYSYSIYMIHPSVLFILTSILMILSRVFSFNLVPIVEGRRLMDLGGGIQNNLLLFFTLLLTCYLSKWTYNNIELRGLELCKKRRTAGENFSCR